LPSHKRGCVRRRDDYDGTRKAFGPEIILYEFSHFASTLPDQREDDDIARGSSGQHRQQRRLPDARTGKKTEALPFSAGCEEVKGTHAKFDGWPNPSPDIGVRRCRPRRKRRWSPQHRPFPIDGISEGIDDTTKPMI
jgi:hypothetical protein